MWIEGMIEWTDYQLHRQGLRYRRILNGLEQSDDEVRDRSQSDQAYWILYERYRTRLFYYVRDEVLFSDEYNELAEDAVQVAFLQIWMRDEPTDPTLELWGLLKCYAHDRARELARSYTKLRSRRKKDAKPAPVTAGEEAADDHRRRQFNNLAPEQLEAKQAREPDPARAVLDAEISDPNLVRVLEGLPADEREIIESYYLQDFPIADLVKKRKKPRQRLATVRRQIYQILHRFRTIVRRQHPLTPRAVEAALVRLDRLLQVREIEAEDLLAGIREEQKARDGDHPLLADLFLSVARARRRILDNKIDKGERSYLENLLFRLRLRSGNPNLAELVANELAAVEKQLRGRDISLARDLRGLLDGLHKRNLILVGRKLRQIHHLIGASRKRAVDMLSDLLMEMQLGQGKGDLRALRRTVQERLLGRITSEEIRQDARRLLGETTTWRKVFKLVLRVEKARKPWKDEQILDTLREIG